jgi:hypothetical protein
MHRRILLALLLIAAATLANAASLQFGPALTAADLPAGEADTYTIVVNGWAHNGETEVIAMRHNHVTWTTARMSVRTDGTVDPNNVQVLPADFAVAAAAMGDGMMIVSYGNAGTLQHVDRAGRLLASAPLTIEPDLYSMQLVCNDSRCIARAPTAAVLVDAAGQLVKNLPPVNVAAATPNGFLVAHDKVLDLIDNDGAVLLSQPAPRVQDVFFDGSRYVVVAEGAKLNDLQVWSVNPATGSTTAPVTIATGTPEGIAVVALAWNGSSYLLLGVDGPRYYEENPRPSRLVTMRLSRTFEAIDSTAQFLTSSDRLLYDRPVPVGVPGGFRLIFTGTFSTLRTAFVSEADGSVTPPLPGGKPAIIDRMSQVAELPAASRSGILSVWTETAADVMHLRAARVSRTGVRVDAVPATLGANAVIAHVATASDGEGYLVSWLESDRSSSAVSWHAALIDGGGGVQQLTLDRSVPLGPVSVEFLGGAYQLAVCDSGSGVAATVSPSGALLFHGSVYTGLRVYDSDYAQALFDGRRMLLLIAARSGLIRVMKDVSTGAVSQETLFPATYPFFFREPSLARDGSGYLIFIGRGDAIGSDELQLLMRLNGDGVLERQPVILTRGSSGFRQRLTVIDGQWCAAWEEPQTVGTTYYRALSIAAFNPLTLIAAPADHLGPQLSDSDLVPGYGGEALLVGNAVVPIASGFAWQANVRVAHLGATLPRAVRR